MVMLSNEAIVMMLGMMLVMRMKKMKVKADCSVIGEDAGKEIILRL